MTAFQIAARNQKVHLLEPFVQAGADVLLPLRDRLGILTEGRFGALKGLTKSLPFVEDIHIAGKVLCKFHQDLAYSLDFVVALLDICLTAATDNDRVYYIDSNRTVSLMHIIATIMDKLEFDRIFHVVRSRFLETNHINVPDLHSDTPLHYAAAARKVHNLRSLLSEGADVFSKNSLGIASHELMVWSTIYLGGRYIKLTGRGRTRWQPGIERCNVNEDGELTREIGIVSPRSQFEAALNIFQMHGCVVDDKLKRLALAWDGADMPIGHFARDHIFPFGRDKIRMQLVPIEATELHIANINGSQRSDTREDTKESEGNNCRLGGVDSPHSKERGTLFSNDFYIN